MTNSLDPSSALKAACGIAVVSFVAYCIWKGLKVTYTSPNHTKQAQHTSWENDDNNPANWYLKDPHKFIKKS